MAGQAEIIIRGKIQKCSAADFHARTGRGIHAAQFAVESLFPQGGKTLVKLIGEWQHRGIYDLRFTIYEQKTNLKQVWVLTEKFGDRKMN